MSPMGRGRKTLFVTIAVVLVLVICELMVFLFFRLVGRRLLLPDPKLYTASAEDVERAKRYYDVDLGWRLPQTTPFGERPRGYDYGRPWVSTYGDSFTYSAEVEDGETWAERLAELGGGDVYNYGASAYGIDQAYLRFERDFVRQPTPFAILGFISPDIKRNLSVYLKFPQPEANFTLTKPRFFWTGGALDLMPNPIRSAEGLAQLRDPQFVLELAAHDDTFNTYRLPALTFPRLPTLLRPDFWRALRKNQDEVDLWSEEESRQITEGIFLRFLRLAEERGVHPHLLHLPTAWELAGYVSDRKLPTSVMLLEEFCRRHGCDCLLPIYAGASLDETEVPGLFAPRGHYSPAGNRWIAERIAEAIVDPGVDDQAVR